MGVPKIFMQMLFKKVVAENGLPENTESLTKDHVQRYWQKLDFHRKTEKERIWHVIKKKDANFMENDDFKPLFVYLLELHPGLEFLKATPEF